MQALSKINAQIAKASTLDDKLRNMLLGFASGWATGWGGGTVYPVQVRFWELWILELLPMIQSQDGFLVIGFDISYDRVINFACLVGQRVWPPHDQRKTHMTYKSMIIHAYRSAQLFEMCPHPSYPPHGFTGVHQWWRQSWRKSSPILQRWRAIATSCRNLLMLRRWMDPGIDILSCSYELSTR